MASVKSSGAEGEALRANKLTLVERLTDDLAHEIKNPLHSLVINLEVLRRRIARSSARDADDLLRYVGILSSELDRVSGRVDLMLRMVRPDQSASSITLREALEELLDLVELERKRRGVEIALSAPPSPPRARIPRAAARQIVLNLLILAIDGAGRGGSVRISSSAVAGEDRLELAIIPAPPAADDTDTPARAPDGAMIDALRALVCAAGGRLDTEAADPPNSIPSALVVFIPVGDG